MNFASNIASCALALTAFSACGDDGGSTAAKGTAAPAPAQPTPAAAEPAANGAQPAADTAAGTEAPANAEPAAPSTDSEAKCKTVLANSWKSLKPALEMIGPEAAHSEEDYVGNSYFLKKCSGLTAEHLDCIAKSENPLLGIAECKLNEGAKSSDKLRLPSFRKSRAKPAELPEKEQAKRLASVVGTWKNEFKSFSQTTTWKISKSGEVKQTTERNGKSEEKDLKLTFEHEGQVKVQNSPTSSQPYSYLVVNKKTVFFCNNLAYGAHPVEKQDDFVLATSSEHVIYKGDTCKVLTDAGYFLDATCAWEGKKKKKNFKVSYQVPGRSHPSELAYDLIAGHLVDKRQVDTSKFVKK